ncbi:DUF3558 domain-containing protein [Actinoalloteichus hymeniacidonis]|uniref:DUF3558 family protein n=1 Tax=Actinoalloteichus hymeniacidonis TaxID=340345 RepID=A0AAC9MVF0_9PSEU|nr:DUF3558 domain-containing protein [Actinoalloteichus hymeniacidonis]AOS61123.1 putative DUF3558 family protein [Actinoalloteichus hymeniacidonis]MBB5910876.1 hypothetical protein [Actinoalloteichus hymeniacidonis]
MTSTRSLTMAGVALAAALLVASCSSEQDGAASPDDTANTDTTQSTSETGQPEAPDDSDSSQSAIENPKDIESTDICALLTPEVAASYGLDPAGEPNEDSAASAGRCAFSGDEGNRVSLAGWYGGQGIDDVYSQEAQFSDWEPMEIAGYPAVRANEIEPSVTCALFVGISDTQYIDFNYTRSGSDEDACAGVIDVATAVVPTLPDAN